MGWLFASGGQSIGASASVLAMSIQGWFSLGLTGLISLLSKQDSHESSPIPQYKSINSSVFSLPYGPTLTSIHDYWENHCFDSTDLCQRSDLSGFFNMLSRFVIAFLPRSKCLLISWLRSPSAVILEPKKIKPATVFHFFPHLFAMKWWDWVP